MYIDDHVHCRDFNESYKGETIGHVLEVAKDSSLSGIFDMPNTNPAVTNRERVLERLAIAESVNSPVFYGTYIGLTSNPDQIKEAVQTYNDYFISDSGVKVGVVGLKMFAGKSVGDLTIAEPEAQKKVYEELVKQKYNGVLVVHCEKESEMYPELWNDLNPVTHCNARPEISEIKSVEDQLSFAFDVGYAKPRYENKTPGKLHIAHISSPQAVKQVKDYRDCLQVSCGATPHHLLLNRDRMEKADGIFYKVNPPLRSVSSQGKLLELFKDGLIDVLETDHAPHTLNEKLSDHMSGIPNLASWPVFLYLLRERGVSDDLINEVAFENVNKIFGTKIPKIDFPIKSHLEEYVFEPYRGLK